MCALIMCVPTVMSNVPFCIIDVHAPTYLPIFKLKPKQKDNIAIIILQLYYPVGVRASSIPGYYLYQIHLIQDIPRPRTCPNVCGIIIWCTVLDVTYMSHHHSPFEFMMIFYC